jgi:hypothetical protein
VLRLKRSNSTVTCPGAWGFLGEHGEGVGETWRRMALRAIEEELGLVQVPRPVDLTPGKSVRGRGSFVGKTECTEREEDR